MPGAALLRMLYFAVMILFAPWTLLLVPFLGVWYIIFFTRFLLYDALNEELRIEERFAGPADGGA